MATTPQLAPSLTSQHFSSPHRRHTKEEMLARFEAAREAVRPYLPKDVDILEELSAERRAEAARELNG